VPSKLFRRWNIYLWTGVGISVAIVFVLIHGGGSRRAKGVIGVCYLFLACPVLIYKIIIALKGTPVVISGNCVLLELDPKWGFLDSPEIQAWWKVVVSISGM
jgi:hypothetical protein